MKRSRIHILLTSAFALMAASALQAESFTLFIYESKAEISARTDKANAPSYWASYAAYAKAMTDAGILRGGTALPGNAETKTVRLVDGKPQESEQPFAVSDLELGGYFVIEVPDHATALEWARKAPGMATGAVEVKRHFPSPAMATK